LREKKVHLSLDISYNSANIIKRQQKLLFLQLFLCLFTKISKNKRIIARKTLYLQSIITLLIRNMENKDLNRIKVVLADKKRTNKWLAERLGKDPATVSKWCTNSAQPNLENLLEIAKCLEVDVNELIRKENL
jgi:DNA-binding Xre family transcriptional regulator